MGNLKNRIDFVGYISVKNANSNGDPLDGNRPRTMQGSDNKGFISDVCLKRKIRDSLFFMNVPIFTQREDLATDGCRSMKERAEKTLGKCTDKDAYAKEACRTWFDTRAFGQVFASAGDKKGGGVSIGIRGPVTIGQAESVDPVDIVSIQITKSLNGDGTSAMSSDRIGMKHMVKFGLYKMCGSINVRYAEKTGFTEEDAETLRQAILHMFDNDASSARPAGSMEIVKLFWFKHPCINGSYPASYIYNSVTAVLKDGKTEANSAEDYEISAKSLPGVEMMEFGEFDMSK